jgi:protein-S-isoprenylcysteine O-methyltransferase Ste14
VGILPAPALNNEVLALSRYIVIACWAAFALYWFIAAFGVKKAAQTQGTRTIFWFRVVQVVNFVLLAGVVPYWPFNIVLWLNSMVAATGSCICVLGAVFAIWARRVLAANWSASVTFKEKHELITHGPYRLARHPIYTGLILMMLGTMLVLGRLDGLVAVVTRAILYRSKIKNEERLMEQHFHHEYSAYRSRVRALVPVPKRWSA